MKRFSKLIRTIQRYSGSGIRSRLLRDARRRLFLEPLETREVLAVAVEALTPTPSGFVAELSAEIRQDLLNLYDTEGAAMGAADVTLTGNATGNVPGSLVVEGTKLTFIATGGALPADTYTVTMRSAANGIVDQALGELLDGEFSGSFPSGNGTPGGNFEFTFSVAANPLVVSIPDFARGPTQDVQVPATGSGQPLPDGLPIQLSNANGVTSFTMTVHYDPALLTITGAELGPDAPTGSQVMANVTVPGEATIAFFSLDPMSGGPADVVNLLATVPEEAPYAKAQVIDITFLEVNAGAVQATADDALHVVAFPGDANANRRYDAEDARLIARAGVGLDSGFVTAQPTSSTATNLLYPTVDAVIIGDVTGVDGLSPLDASDVLRRVVGLPTPNIPALPAGQAPTELSLSATSVAENQPIGTVVGTFSTTDPDLTDTHTYTLVAGQGDANNDLFAIDGSALETAGVLDHLTQETLSVRVRTTDPTGRSFDRVFMITVTDVNEAPTAVAISNDTVAEDISIGSSVGTLTATDPDQNNTHTYSLVTGNGDTDNVLFEITGDQLQVASALDFETKSEYSVRVRATDQGGLSVDQVFTINVTDVNEAPTSLALSNTTIAEGVTNGTVVGTLSTIDQDSGNTHTYSLVAGTGDVDNFSFSIVGNEVRTADTFDFESQSTYSIRVQSTDQGTLSVQQILTIAVTNVNEVPTAIALSNNTVAEDTAVGAAVGTLSTTDPDAGDTHTYSLVAGDGGADNASFTIVDDELRVAAALDFESQSTYSIRVQSTDVGGLSFQQVLIITATDVNDAPTAIAVSNDIIAEDVAIGTAVGTLSTTDQDSGDTHTYSLAAGDGNADNDAFTIVGDELRTAAGFDFEVQDTFSIRMQSTDAGGLSVQQVLTINVANVNETPTAIAISNAAVPENEPAGTSVGTLTTSDPDVGDTHTYVFVSGNGDTDNGSFTIDGDQLRTAEVFDQSTKDTYSIRVQSTDAGDLTVEQVLTITIGEANVAPTDAALSNSSVEENAAVDTLVGTLSTTDANSGDTHTYSLVAGPGDADNASFTIVDDQLRTVAVPDFENQNTFSIRVRSTDPWGLSVEQVLAITVTDVNEAPTAIAVSNDIIAEDVVVGTVVGTLSTTDQDAGDTHTYNLAAGDGDTDNATFTIVGDELRTATTFDFDTQNTFSIRVQSTDAGGLSVEQVLTVTITDANVAPTDVALSSTSVDENVAVGTVIGMFSTTDANVGDTHTYELVAGSGDTDNSAFTIVGDELRTAAEVDFETQDSYSIRVRTTDQDGEFFEQILILTVNDLTE